MGTQRTGAAGAASRIQVSRTGRLAPAPRMGFAPTSAAPLPLDEVLIGDCIAALDAHGPCIFHRRSFAPVRIAGDA